MKIRIQATNDFKKYLEESYPDIVIQKSETMIVESSYNAFFTMKPGDILISIMITYSPMMFNAINNYVSTTHQSVIVTTDEEQFGITPQNVKSIIPVMQKEALFSFEEEQNE